MSCTADRTGWAFARIPSGAKSTLALAVGATALVVSSALYCELHGPIYGNPPPTASVAWAWAINVSVAWIALAVAIALSSALRSLIASRASPTFCAVAFVATILSEWLLGLVGQAAGLFESARSLGEVAYERAPLAVAGAALIVLICKRVPSQWERSAAGTHPAAATLQVLTAVGKCSVLLADVERFTSNENYVQVHCASGRTYLLRTTMERLAQTLGSPQFVRVHRSAIVNRAKIVERRRGHLLVLASGCVVRVGRTYRERIDL